MTYNAEKWIKPLLESIMGQTVKCFEIIVIDNASSDDTVNIVKKFPEVVVMPSPSNVGFAAANNKASKIARGTHLLFLNPDTKLDRRAIEEATKHIMRSSGAIVALAQRQYDSGQFLTNGNGVDWLGYPMGLDTAKVAFYADGAAMIVPRDIFLRLNGFDEALFMFHEDIDFCWRAQISGYSIESCRNAIVFHASGASAAGGAQKGRVYFTTYFRRFHGEKNILRNILKNFALWRLPFGVVCYLLQQAIEILVMALFGRPEFAAADLAAIYWNMQHLRDTLVERKASQETRAVSDIRIVKRMYWGLAKYKALRTVGMPKVFRAP